MPSWTQFSGHKLPSISGAFSGRGSGPGSLLRPTKVLGSAIRPKVTSVAEFGVDLRLSPFGGGFSDRQLVLVVEPVKQAVLPHCRRQCCFLRCF
jgi:hypothetical protein